MASIVSGGAQQGKKVITCFCGDAFVDVQTSAMPRLPIWGHDTRVDSVKVLAGGSLCNVARRFGALVNLIQQVVSLPKNRVRKAGRAVRNREGYAWSDTVQHAPRRRFY